MKKTKGSNFLGNKKYMEDENMSSKSIADSWCIKFKGGGNAGEWLRNPQIGAFGDIKAHLTVSDEIATVVMPTGTGKTETMLFTIACEHIEKTLVIVPSAFLRRQMFEKACTFGILRKIGVVSKSSKNPNVVLLSNSVKTEEEFNKLLENTNILIATIWAGL